MTHSFGLSAEYILRLATPVLVGTQHESSTSSTPFAKDTVEERKKQIKLDSSVFPTLKDATGWHCFKNSTLIQAAS